jgi:hypothetical protein
LVPEVVHLVSLVAGEGPTLVRKSAYGTIINLLQSLHTARPDEGESEIKQLMDDCSLPKNLKLFGLQRETPTSEYINLDHLDDKSALDSHECLLQLLVRVLDVSAGNQGTWDCFLFLFRNPTSFRFTKCLESSMDESRHVYCISTVPSRPESIIRRPCRPRCSSR